MALVSLFVFQLLFVVCIMVYFCLILMSFRDSQCLR